MLLMIFCCSPILVYAEQSIMVDYGKLYNITYDSKGVTVFDVVPNSDDIELIFEIDVSSQNATLELTIPRDLLDSKENGNDAEFLVIADGEDVTFTEMESTDTTRTLFMELTSGTKEIEIFGTDLAGASQNEPVPEETQQPTEQEKPSEIPTEEIPTEKTEESKPIEQAPEQSPEESPEEKIEPKTDQKQFETIKNIFDFSKLPTWSIQVNENQLYQFAMTTGAFIGLVIVLIALKGLRTEKSLP